MAKKILFWPDVYLIILLAMFFTSCGDDGSGVNSFEQTPETSLLVDDANSSSSVDVLPSSAMVNESSSSENLDESSSSAESSSSEKKELLSSSAEKSSSSEVLDESSSSMKNENSSNSVKTEESSSAEIFDESSSSVKNESSSSSVKTEISSSSEVSEKSSSSITLSSSSETPTVKSIYDAENNTLTDLRDNKVYKTVTIGEQIWTAENMNYKYKAGSKSFCYNNSEKYCSLYGRLYTSDSKNVICPEKWHLPDSTEWEILFKFTGNQTSVLKADSGWSPWGKENTNGTNDFGFSVYPAGYKTILDGYTGLGEDAWFWVRKGYWIPYIPGVNRTPPDFVLSSDYRALPIRCIKDSE